MEQEKKFEQNKLKLSGDRVFHTIQGEGINIGKPATFIRLHECNLECTFCDTKYTWDTTLPEYHTESSFVSLDELQQTIQQEQDSKGVSDCKHLVFTGGEPMLQQKQIQQFIRRYPGYTIEIETNGTIYPQYLAGYTQIMYNVSPKLENSGNEQEKTFRRKVIEKFLELDSYFKFVVSDISDLDTVDTLYDFIPKDRIIIMPEGITKEENTATYEKTILEIIKRGYRTIPRGQNIMFDGAKRRV